MPRRWPAEAGSSTVMPSVRSRTSIPGWPRRALADLVDVVDAAGQRHAPAGLGAGAGRERDLPGQGVDRVHAVHGADPDPRPAGGHDHDRRLPGVLGGDQDRRDVGDRVQPGPLGRPGRSQQPGDRLPCLDRGADRDGRDGAGYCVHCWPPISVESGEQVIGRDPVRVAVRVRGDGARGGHGLAQRGGRPARQRLRRPNPAAQGRGAARRRGTLRRPPRWSSPGSPGVPQGRGAVSRRSSRPGRRAPGRSRPRSCWSR